MNFINELLNNRAVTTILATMLGAFITWLTTKGQREFEYKKLELLQKYKEKEKWHDRFIDLSSSLLSELDPYISQQSSNKIQIIKLIHQVQILLNSTIKEHATINHFITELGLAITKETNSHNYEELLSLHGKLSYAISDVTALKY